MKITVVARDEYTSVTHTFAADKKSYIQVDDEGGQLYISGKKQNAVFAKGEWISATRDLK